jgi:ankyrin repeat protein
MSQVRGIRYIDIADNDGQTALHVSAILRNAKMIEALIDAGARMEEATNDGETAVNLAALNGNLKAIETLVERGANSSIFNKTGETVQDLAWAYGCNDVAEFLQGEETKLKC